MNKIKNLEKEEVKCKELENINEHSNKSSKSRENRRKDLVGQRFGKLIVKEMLYGYKNKRTYVKCDCDCGIKGIIKTPGSLSQSTLPSCGCARKEIAQKNCGKNIDGMKFGRLTILETIWKSNPPTVRCNCDCGTKDFIARKNDVQCGHTQSCGCLQKETVGIVNEKDWTDIVASNGVKFLKKYKKNEKSQWIWECECPYCHNIFYEIPARINNNHVKSCGCEKRSIMEKQIANILDINGYDYEKEYSFEDLKSDKNYKLRFDFAIKNTENNIDCLLEYDGRQHYQPVEKFGGNQALERTQYLDNLKNEYCKNNNMKLIRIPYTKTLEEIEAIIKNIHNP